MEVDWSVGQIMEALKRNQLEKETLVIFTSDNGPWLNYGDHAGSAGPLREGKGTMFEGGCRVPCIMRWPGHIPADTKCTTPAMTIDILPTIAEIIGAPLPSRPIDGRSILSLMTGAPDLPSPHEAYYLYYGTELQAIRSGRWKLHFPHAYRTLSGRPGGTGGKSVKYDQATIELSLFDLQADVGETTNVADQHPDVVRRLTALAETAREDLGDGPNHIGKGVRAAGEIQTETPSP
jgi:arylsulfatase A-like enzyme